MHPEQVKQLASNLLDDLLTAGDAQERVWAAWEIGLRFGKQALPRISLQAHEAPDPGTRRHMVVVVAGFGHYSVLTTLAFHDPDESVRGTATQYLIRITDECDTAKINLITKLLEEDRSPIVKQALLANWNYKKQQIPIGLLFGCAGNKSENVRQAAIEQIVRQYSASGLSADQIISCLSNQITKESICLFSNWLLKWELQDLIVVSAERALSSSSLQMLDFLADKDLKFSWNSLKKLSERKNPEIDIRILNILLVEEDIDLILWLAFGIARAIDLPQVTSHAQYLEQQSAANFHHSAIDHFLFLIKKMPLKQLDFSDIQNFKTILSHLENNIDYFDEYDDGDYWEEEGINLEEYIEQVRLNCDCLKKWLNMNA